MVGLVIFAGFVALIMAAGVLLSGSRLYGLIVPLIIWPLVVFKNSILGLFFSVDQLAETIPIYRAALALDFVAILIFGSFALLRGMSWRVANPTVILVALLVVYSGYGLASVPATSVASYLKVFIAAYLCFKIGQTYSYGFAFFSIPALAIVIYVVAEAVAGVNTAQISFVPIKYNNPELVSNNIDISSALSTSIGDFRFVRLTGPQVHPTSFGYTLLNLLLLCALYQPRVFNFLFLFMLPALFFSSKGAFLMAINFFILFKLMPRRLTLVYLCIMQIVTLAVASIPITSAYDHLQGLLFGLESVIRQPWGHGLGVGGNLSIGFASVQFGSESYIGVLLHQLGLFASLFVLGYVRLAFQVSYRRPLFLYMLLLLCNATLQEEAVSLSSIVLVFFLVGYEARGGKKRVPGCG